MIKNWLKIAFINYKKNGLSTLINVLGISVGLCIFLLVFINWQDEKSYEQWIPDKENIYFVENKNSYFGYLASSSYPELAVSKEKFDEIEDFTVGNLFWNGKIRLMANGKSAFTSNAKVSDSFFDFFPYEIIAGNYKNAINGDSKSGYFRRNGQNSVWRRI